MATKYKTFCYYLLPSDGTNLRMLAKENNCSASAMVRALIRLAVEASNEDKNNKEEVAKLLVS
jgi:hypothetical protein